MMQMISSSRTCSQNHDEVLKMEARDKVMPKSHPHSRRHSHSSQREVEQISKTETLFPRRKSTTTAENKGNRQNFHEASQTQHKCRTHQPDMQEQSRVLLNKVDALRQQFRGMKQDSATRSCNSFMDHDHKKKPGVNSLSSRNLHSSTQHVSPGNFESASLPFSGMGDAYRTPANESVNELDKTMMQQKVQKTKMSKIELNLALTGGYPRKVGREKALPSRRLGEKPSDGGDGIMKKIAVDARNHQLSPRLRKKKPVAKQRGQLF